MREFIRHPSGIPIEFSLAEAQDSGIETMRNISRGGLSFTSPRTVAVGAQLWIRIPGKQFKARARVAWCKPLAQDPGRDDVAAYEIGVTFDEHDDVYAMRMVEQVCHIEQYRQDVRKNEGRNISSAEAAEEWIQRFAGEFPDTPTAH